jgi:uncharacterized RDD family membrane protein YckC
LETPPPENAGLGRRFLAMLYEGLLLLAVLFVSALAFQGAAITSLVGWSRHLFQLYLFLIIGLYFIWCWLRGGQTLAMKTWKLKLVQVTGDPITPKQALVRYVFAWISFLTIGLGFLWAAIDRDRQFLHDRLAATRIVKKNL